MPHDVPEPVGEPAARGGPGGRQPVPGTRDLVRTDIFLRDGYLWVIEDDPTPRHQPAQPYETHDDPLTMVPREEAQKVSVRQLWDLHFLPLDEWPAGAT